YGHRNPWRWSFDRASGELWLGDVGQNTWEEIDRVVKGGNYGWNICEGFHRRDSTTALCATGGLLDPIVEHNRTEAASITGGYVYRGTAMPSLVGTYIYGDFSTGNIWALTFDANNKATPKLLATGVGGISSFGQGNDGEVYVVQLNGTISKLVPSAPPMTDNFPQLLSATGCVDPSDPTRPAAGVIPYELNAPLWSDGADKQRFMGIPDGATIAIGGAGDWDLPIGSVAMKVFSVGGKRVETRLFMRHDDGAWAGYTYEWNDDGTDATLLPGSKLKTLSDTAAWAYPSRSQCIQCHSSAAGGTLGLDTAQLNRDVVYAATNRMANQLATLDHIGMFSAPLAQSPSDLPRLSEYTSADPV
ncbi:MAG: PQQ-dependent sugar dehydrogenase, partial [Solirubrobacteraceae bacterium]